MCVLWLFDHNLLAVAQNVFQAEFDVIGFDHVMNRAQHDRLRPKQDS